VRPQCVLLAEVNHRIANQFAVLASYIHLSLEEFRRHPGEVRDLQLAFAAVEARARALASLNKQLMKRPMSSQAVDVSVMLHDVCTTFGGNGNAFHSVVDEITGPFLVTHRVNVAAGQMVTEAVMNALKYAYPDDHAGQIIVRSTPAESGELLIQVIDRGLGGPTSLPSAAKSFGIRLMRGLAHQENIGLRFIAMSPGLSVHFVLPSAGQSGGNPAEEEAGSGMGLE
jgi:two-component sensor histidine kinase